MTRQCAASTQRIWLERIIIAGALAVYCSILAACAWLHSPTFNEVGHLPAAICHWRYQRFELYRVNPPLPRMIAAIPVLFCNPSTDWGNYDQSPNSQETIPIAVRFINANGERVFSLFSIARLACISFCVWGAFTCYWWARDLWGKGAGALAACLWCTHPMLLGHGPLVMPDVPAAAAGAFAAYQFYRWTHDPTWLRTLAAGVFLGIAQLCKTTLLVIIPIWIAFGLYSEFSSPRNAKASINRMTKLWCICTLALYVINAGYGFTDVLQPLGEFSFRSRLLSGAWEGDAEVLGNRFKASYAGRIPVPLPRDYIQGIDSQLADFDVGDRSYLRGEWKRPGWWYYHIYGLLVKTPVGMLLITALAITLTVVYGLRSQNRHAELLLIVHSLAILVLVSSKTGFSNHVRYSIPCLPFTIIWVAKCMEPGVGIKHWIRRAVVILAACSTASSLYSYPHFIAYFNETIRPVDRHWHLIDSNLAWGQDLLFLRKWYIDHPEARPLHAALFGWVDPRLAGISFTLPPTGPSPENARLPLKNEVNYGPQPGWYAIDVNYLHGSHFLTSDGAGQWRRIDSSDMNYMYFLDFEPIYTIGNSIYIYNISHSDANIYKINIKSQATSHE